MKAPARIGMVIGCLVLSTTCGGKTPIQPPPSPDQLQLSCAEPLVVEATRPDGAEAHFGPPPVAGGVPPYTIECAPASGSVFPVGETAVHCTGSDAAKVQASCEFLVRVRVSQTLSRTRFTAFGDSITRGVVTLTPLLTLDEAATYPVQLERMLATRYPLQTFVVTNRGESGETTRRGVARLPQVLEMDQPEVLLLFEGTNNVKGITTTVQAEYLEAMIKEALRRHVDVIIATVMPISESREEQHRGTMAAIRALNQRIVELASRYNLGNPVDLFALFEANPQLLGADGLHSNAEGQTRIAEAFLNEIVHHFEARSAITH
jgi:acyl-CoA thioesterase I